LLFESSHLIIYHFSVGCELNSKVVRAVAKSGIKSEERE